MVDFYRYKYAEAEEKTIVRLVKIGTIPEMKQDNSQYAVQSHFNSVFVVHIN